MADLKAIGTRLSIRVLCQSGHSCKEERFEFNDGEIIIKPYLPEKGKCPKCGDPVKVCIVLDNPECVENKG